MPEMKRFLHLAFVLFFCSLSLCGITGVQEFCFMDVFAPGCPPGSVINMTHARYGRMRVGRCVKEILAPDYEGCYADVLDLAHRKCSGRTTCSLQIPDTDFELTKPCSELQNYLEADYTCMRVEQGEATACRSCDFIKVKATSGYLSSFTTQASGCGSTDCPWLIEAFPGQRIKVQLIDFGVSQQRFSSPCRVYAVLKETSARNHVTVCGGKRRREIVMTTDGNSLEVRIMGKSSSDQQTHFLLHYEVTGCPEPEVTEGSWVRRHGDKATVTCHDSGQSVTITCNTTSWNWQVQPLTCAQDKQSGVDVMSTSFMDLGISISLIAAIAIVIGVLILTVGLVCFKKRSTRPQQRQLPPHHPSELEDPVYDVYGDPPCDIRSYLESQGHGQSTIKSARIPVYIDNPNNEYTHIWEQPLPQPRPHTNQSV